MDSIHQKQQAILENERRFANTVSAEVIDKPKLNIWMILIPVIFVHYFYRLKKYAEGRKDFARNFLLTRERALAEAASAVESNRQPDTGPLVRMSSIPEGTSKAYIRWLNVLLEHYRELLQSPGGSYEVLVRAAYKNRTNYLLFLNTLGDVEKGFNRELKPHLTKETPDANGIIQTIESCCANIRRAEAERIFP